MASGPLAATIADASIAKRSKHCLAISATSSAPLVSGVIALMYGANPRLTEAEVHENLKDVFDAFGFQP